MTRFGRAIALALCLGTAACAGSSPDPAVYTLAPVAGAARPGTTPRSVELRRIGLAGYLDRPEIVRTTSEYRLAVSSAERWGEPLDSMIGRVLAEDLGQRLPGTTLFVETGAVSAEGEAILEVDIQRFDAGPDGAAVVLAQVSARPARRDGPRLTRTVRFAVPPAGTGTAALVAALSAGTGQLADAAAALLRGLPAAPPAPP